MKGMSAIETTLIITVIIVAVLAIYFGWQYLVVQQAYEQYQRERCQGLGWFGCAWENLWQHKGATSGVTGLGAFGLCMILGIPAHIASLGATTALCGAVGAVSFGIPYIALGGTTGSFLTSVFGGLALPILAGIVGGFALSIGVATFTGGAIAKIPYLILLVFLIGFVIGAYLGQTIIDLLPWIAGFVVVGLAVFLYLKYIRK